MPHLSALDSLCVGALLQNVQAAPTRSQLLRQELEAVRVHVRGGDGRTVACAQQRVGGWRQQQWVAAQRVAAAYGIISGNSNS